MANISEELADLEDKVAEVPDIFKIKRMQFLRKKLDELSLKKTESLIFRSKAKWYHLGEKNTSYFLNLEKSKYNARTCNAILLDDGNIVTNPKNILKQQQLFYQRLYQRENTSPFDLINTSGPKLSEDNKELLDREIALTEYITAVKTMKNGKTPGNDGIPIEFYKIFWADISDPLIQAIEEGFEQNRFHPYSQTRHFEPHTQTRQRY